MNLSVDKKTIEEGQYVLLTWDCGDPDQVSLVVEEGASRRVLPLSNSGTTSVLPTGESDTMRLRLRCVDASGKVLEEERTVKVKRRVLKAERVDGSPFDGGQGRKTQSSGDRPAFLERAGQWWRRRKEAARAFWSVQPKDKKLAFKVLGILVATDFLVLLSPRLLPVGLFATGLYLVWYLARR